MKLSIIIPCYNERGNLPLIFQRLRETLKNRTDVEIMLVNNGSTDGSGLEFVKLIGQYSDPRFTLVEIKENQGYGFGILSGLAKAQGDVLAWTHADMQTDPVDVLKAYDLYQSNQQLRIVVKGKRKNRSRLEAFFTWGMQIVAWFALKVHLNDINAQPKLFSREFYDSFLKDKSPWDFSLDLFFLCQARRHEYKILEIPVFFAKRLHGHAKGGGSWKTRIKLMRRTFQYIFELRKDVLTPAMWQQSQNQK